MIKKQIIINNKNEKERARWKEVAFQNKKYNSEIVSHLSYRINTRQVLKQFNH